MTSNTTMQISLVGVAFAWLVTACGAGPYGFARYYEPNDDEKQFHERATTVPYGVVASKPQDFENVLVAWFGIVEKAELIKDGRHLVRMTHHQHKERHLCADETSSSCRVTVNFKSSGGFSAALLLKPEDLVPGLDKIQPGTLMRVFGQVRCWKGEEVKKECAFDENGGIILDGVFYRQWPARFYSTTRAAGVMRR